MKLIIKKNTALQVANYKHALHPWRDDEKTVFILSFSTRCYSVEMYEIEVSFSDKVLPPLYYSAHLQDFVSLYRN